MTDLAWPTFLGGDADHRLVPEVPPGEYILNVPVFRRPDWAWIALDTDPSEVADRSWSTATYYRETFMFHHLRATVWVDSELDRNDAVRMLLDRIFTTAIETERFTHMGKPPENIDQTRIFGYTIGELRTVIDYARMKGYGV